MSTPIPIATGQYDFLFQPLTFTTVGNGARAVSPNVTKSGILNKITFPTGGYTVFEYEPNSYSIENKTFKIENWLTPNNTISSSNFTPTNYVSGSGQLEIYFPKAEKEKSNAISTVTYDNETYNRPLSTGSTHPEQSLLINKEFGNSTHTLKALSYLYNNDYQLDDYKSTYSYSLPSCKITATWKEYSGVEKIVGGLRIKSVKSYDGINQTPVSFKQFEYVYANELIEYNWGIVIKDVLAGVIDLRPDMSWRRYRLPYYSVSNITNNNLGVLPTVNYGKVIERELDSNPIPNTNPVAYNDLGKVEYYFEPMLSEKLLDLKSEPILFKNSTFSTSGFPASVKSLLKFNKYKIPTNTLTNTKKLIYKRDDSNNLKLISSTENISKDIYKIQIPYKSVFTMHYEAYFDPSEQEMTSTNPNTQEFVNTQFYYYNNTETITKKETVQSIYTEYDTNETPSLKTVTNYFYDNPSHNELTRIETSDSKNNAIKKQLFYPADLLNDGIQPAEMQKLINQNRIGSPIRTKTFINNVQTSETLTKYAEDTSTGNYLLPKEIHETKGTTTAFPFNNQNRKIEYTLYDTNNGNILEFKKPDGIPSVIIWGYNKTQPIAKIENATYTSIPSATISDLQTKSNADTDSTTEDVLRSALNSLRTSLPNSQTTTYTYNPLIGVTSVTDSKGLTTYYEYDTFNRLKFIKDQNQNVIQYFCYNNKGQVIDCSQISQITYTSAAKSGTFIKNNCTSGTGSSVTYTVAAGAYSSTISQADADSKAQNDVNTNGQNYANTNGTCIPPTYTYINNQLPFDSNTMRITVKSSTANHESVIFKFKLVCSTGVIYKDIILASGQISLFATFTAQSNSTRTLTLLGTEYIP